MTDISPEEVSRLAKLGRLQLTATEIEQATQNLGDIFSHFAVIQKIDTTDVPPADDVSGLKNQARVDEAQPEVLAATADLLAQAPAVVNNQIQVKAIFE